MVLRISTASILYRKEFNSSNKHADETLKNWYDRVKVLAELCDYGSHLEAFILNQFVCGLDTFILEHFRSEQKDLSVNDVFDLTKSFEHNSDLVVVVSLTEMGCCDLSYLMNLILTERRVGESKNRRIGYIGQ